MWVVLSGILHDIRQPLSVIEICADYLSMILPETEPRARQQLELLHEQVGDADRVIGAALDRLKSHYGRPEGKPVPPPAAASRPSTNAERAAVTY
jgi:signal transduction histidine kinase